VIPAMLLRGHDRPSFASLAVAVVTAVRPECRGDAPVDLALIATAAADQWCCSTTLPRPPFPHSRDVLLACKRAGHAHRIRTDGAYHARSRRALTIMAAEINASAEPRATVLCAVLLDLLNDRHEPEFAALSRKLTRLDRVLPRGEGVEARASQIAEMIRGEMGR